MFRSALWILAVRILRLKIRNKEFDRLILFKILRVGPVHFKVCSKQKGWNEIHSGWREVSLCNVLNECTQALQ